MTSQSIPMSTRLLRSRLTPSPMVRLGAVCALATSSLLFGGCESRLTGNEGNFEFSYPADDDYADFNKPIAVGATLDVAVRDVGDGLPVELSAAAFDAAEVLTVETFATNVVTIRAVSEGEGLLSVEGATNSGETLTDSVNFLARTPEVLKLRHTCASGQAAYVAGTTVVVEYDLEMENGQAVIGKGVYPVTSDIEGALTVNPALSSQRFIALDVDNTAQNVVLQSTLDDNTLEMNVIAPGQIDGVDRQTADLSVLRVGEIDMNQAFPTVGATRVCQANLPKTVVSQTPSTCAVRDRVGESGDFEFGLFEIEGLAIGECRYAIEYPLGNGGAGARETFTIEVVAAAEQ